MKNLTKLALLPGFMVLGGVAHATTIPATISSTLTITTNSQLTTDVACTVTGAPCIQFGASGIKLQLNGHTMTGNGGQTSCTFRAFETGIDTNLKNNVTIQGPGLVTKFQNIGILVSGNNSMVEGVAVTSVCAAGIELFGSKNEAEGNSVSLASLINFSGAIESSSGSGGHRILHNEAAGNPVGIHVSTINNLIEANVASGDSIAPGPGINFDAGATGNTVRHNQALGNFLGDIFDNNALPANTYDHNLCQTSNISVCNTPLPNIAGHENFEPD